MEFNAQGTLNILQIILALEPAAFNLIASLAKGLEGKPDAEVLAADSDEWGAIVVAAHAAQQP